MVVVVVVGAVQQKIARDEKRSGTKKETPLTNDDARCAKIDIVIGFRIFRFL